MTRRNEEILKEMLRRATSNEKPERLAVEILSNLINGGDKPFVDHAKQILLEDIKSKDVTKAVRTIGILKDCFEKGGTVFQKEISKFRFLNNLIEMVSKKHLGPKTPQEVQSAILEFLLFCSIQYPQFENFKDSYNLLKNDDYQNASLDQVPLEAQVVQPQPRPTFFQDQADEQKFLKLLKSTNKEDVKKANMYLQHFYQKVGSYLLFI